MCVSSVPSQLCLFFFVLFCFFAHLLSSSFIARFCVSGLHCQHKLTHEHDIGGRRALFGDGTNDTTHVLHILHAHYTYSFYILWWWWRQQPQQVQSQTANSIKCGPEVKWLMRRRQIVAVIHSSSSIHNHFFSMCAEMIRSFILQAICHY